VFLKGTELKNVRIRIDQAFSVLTLFSPLPEYEVSDFNDRLLVILVLRSSLHGDGSFSASSVFMELFSISSHPFCSLWNSFFNF
jgi:hypothetical protein